MSETARRVRIAIEILQHSDGLSEKDLLKLYSGEEQIKLRINRLKENGNIAASGGYLKMVGKKYLFMFHIMRVLYLIVFGFKR